jgi:hypothetical protein
LPAVYFPFLTPKMTVMVAANVLIVFYFTSLQFVTVYRTPPHWEGRLGSSDLPIEKDRPECAQSHLPPQWHSLDLSLGLLWSPQASFPN